MAEFRVIKLGKKFIPQKRWLWIFWCGLSKYSHRTWLFESCQRDFCMYRTEEDAREAIADWEVCEIVEVL